VAIGRAASHDSFEPGMTQFGVLDKGGCARATDQPAGGFLASGIIAITRNEGR
jgi:hypothetical protein